MPTVLPASGVTGADVDAVKFTETLRGYKTSEVDWCWTAARSSPARGQPSSAHAAAAAGVEAEAAPGVADARGRPRAEFTVPEDELVRCHWAAGCPRSQQFELYRDHHDKEWGQPLQCRVRCSNG